MTAKEAYAKLKTHIDGMKVVKCFEYDSRFTFQLAPENLDPSKDSSRLLMSPISVNKKTGEVRDFKPFSIPINEYRRGVEVRDYE